MSSPKFADCFCAKNNIPREDYARAVFNRALYRRTHLVKWLLPLLHTNYFTADYDMIYAVESLSRRRDFTMEAHRFNEHPANRGWLRRTLCLRISTARLKDIIRETLPRSTEQRSSEHNESRGTVVPFEIDAGSTDGDAHLHPRLKAAVRVG